MLTVYKGHGVKLVLW